jgi:uncharacterized protein
VGAPKSGTELNARAILEMAGMSYEDLGHVEYLPFNESVELMKNRQLDATLQSAGLGVASIKDLSASIAVTIVTVPSEVIEALGPPYLEGIIPAGTYGQSGDILTAAIGNVLVTRASISDDLAYAMAKALFENLDTMIAAHNAARGIRMEAATHGLPIPLHPGAERFYKEMGLVP